MVNDLSSVLGLLAPKLSKYTPHEPFAKQVSFLMQDKREVLYGGSLGSGKSDAVLMAALQYVHIPGYSALVLRRTLTDLKQQGALLQRITEWMAPYLSTKEVKYVASDHAFHFKTYHPISGERQPDAVIQFGYIGEQNARVRYQGIELQFVAFDELTQHKEDDYKYLFTRLRKCVCPIHTERDRNENPIYVDGCVTCGWAKVVPLRMRSTCNPDGIGFKWVKERFSISPDRPQEEAEQLGIDVKWVGKDPERPFIRATFRDNPYLDHEEYHKNLVETLGEDSDMYQALVKGSWGVLPNARFKKRWKRAFSRRGNFIWLGPNYNGKIIDISKDIQEVFQTVDTATTRTDGPGDMDLNPSKMNPSHTVISTFMLTKCYNLLWVDMLRFREEIPEVVDLLKQKHDEWKPSVVIVEENGVGKGVKQYAQRHGMNIKGVFADTDKVQNATNAILYMQRGRIWFPEYGHWVQEADDEIFVWQGHPKESDDVVDTLSHACNHVDWTGMPNDSSEFFTPLFGSEATIETAPRCISSKLLYKPSGH
jgi:predicted phage terminase large subunit-like protein